MSASDTPFHVRRRRPRHHQLPEWQLSTTHAKEHGSARQFVGTEYISLTQSDLDYLVRVLHIIQQQLRDYIIALPEVFSYVTSSLISVSYIGPVPNASENIDYPHLYEEIITYV